MGNLNPWYCIIFLWYFIMKTNMYDYICETPDVLTYIINNRKEIVQEFVNEYKDKKIDQNLCDWFWNIISCWIICKKLFRRNLKYKSFLYVSYTIF